MSDVEITQNETYPVIIKHATPGWGGSGFSRKITTLQARNLGSKVQIEIEIEEHKPSGRCYTYHSSVSLSRDAAKKLGNLLLNEE